MNDKAEYYIKKLQLQPHPEGGYFKEVYRSEESFGSEFFPKRYNGSRTFSTSIYFLLEGGQVSTFHKLKSDEIWHFYDGCGVKIYILASDGQLSEIQLGKNLDSGELFQVTIKKNCWFGAELKDKNSFALIGCSVAPGFEFDDFELGKRDFLLKLYPQHDEIIKTLTKAKNL